MKEYLYQVLAESGNVYQVYASDEYQAIGKIEVAHEIPQAWRKYGWLVWNAY